MKPDWIRSRTVESLTKGIPPQDPPLPVAVIRRDLMEANRRWMRTAGGPRSLNRPVPMKGLIEIGASGGRTGAQGLGAAVQSRPAPGRAYRGLGKRDISSDRELPTPIASFRPGHEQGSAAATPSVRKDVS